MKLKLKKAAVLLAAGVLLCLALALYGGAHFSTPNSAAEPKQTKQRSNGDSPNPLGKARADRPRAADEEDFLGRADELKSEIHADRENALVYQDRIRQLLQDWAVSDPEAALSYALSSGGQDPVEGLFFAAADAALTVWAGQDAERARRYVEQKSESPRWAAELGPSMMRAYTAREPGKGREWIDAGFKDDSGALRPVVANELVLILCELGRKDEVGQWLGARQVGECVYAQKAAGTFAEQLAQVDINDALAFSKKLPRGSMSRGLALQQTLRVWTIRNADQAFQWITATSASEQLMTEKTSVIVEEESLTEAAYTPDELDHAISGYVLALAKTSNKQALENLKSIVNPSLKQRIGNEAAFMESE